MAVDPSYGLQLELRPKRPRWGPWATIGWGLVIAVAYLATQFAAALGFIAWWEMANPDQPLNLTDLETNGPVLGTVTLVSTIVVIGIVLGAIRLSGVPATEYLALKWPSRRSLLIGLLLTAIMLPLLDFITAQSGREVVPEFMSEIYTTSQDAGPLFSALLALTLVVLAPLGEEIVFRGFFFRGFVIGFGPVAAILFTSLIWAALHVQYEPFFMAHIVVFGLVLGWIRWRSGSLLLAMLIHAIINLLALVQVSVIGSA